MTIAVVVGVLAMLGIFLYAQGSANPFLFSVLVLGWTGLLVLAIAKRYAANAWIAAGQVLVMTCQLVNSIAEARDWPASQIHEIAVVGYWLLVPATTPVVVALAMLVKSELRERRSAHLPGAS
jgi:hypothetical protein